MPEYFRVVEPFFAAQRNGVSLPYVTGQIVSDADPEFKGREHLFEPISNAVDRATNATETASAGPGERRFRGRMKTADVEPKKAEDQE